ncbi:MAG: hypothetical protein AAF694_03550 [Bacteroidota bacterium]
MTRNNNFKKIEPEATLPPEVKKETLSNLDSMKLVLDLVDLFFFKASNTFAGSLSPDSPIRNEGNSDAKNE